MNTQITEDYVSFEVAKLLKEKGFDAETEHELWYVVEKFSTGCHWNSCTYKVGDITKEYDEKCCIAMPTLQMAMKWLRKVHNIHIRLINSTSGDYRFEIYWNHGDFFGANWYCESYELAADEAIKYCLENLI